MARSGRRPAAAARVVVTGLSVSGTVGLVVAMGAASAASNDDSGAAEAVPVTSSSSSTAATAPTTVSNSDEVLVIELHRTVYVDENGNVLGSDAVDSGAAEPGSTRQDVTAPSRRTTPRAPRRGTTTPATSAPASTTPVSTNPATTTPATTTPAPPRCSGSNCP